MSYLRIGAVRMSAATAGAVDTSKYQAVTDTYDPNKQTTTRGAKRSVQSRCGDLEDSFMTMGMCWRYPATASHPQAVIFPNGPGWSKKLSPELRASLPGKFHLATPLNGIPFALQDYVRLMRIPGMSENEAKIIAMVRNGFPIGGFETPRGKKIVYGNAPDRDNFDLIQFRSRAPASGALANLFGFVMFPITWMATESAKAAAKVVDKVAKPLSQVLDELADLACPLAQTDIAKLALTAKTGPEAAQAGQTIIQTFCGGSGQVDPYVSAPSFPLVPVLLIGGAAIAAYFIL